MVQISKHSFRVIGVLRERVMDTSKTTKFCAITTAQKLLSGISMLFARVKISDEQKLTTVDGIKEILRERHNIDIGAPIDFDVQTSGTRSVC